MTEDELLKALNDESLNIQCRNDQKVIDDYVGQHEETTRLKHLQLRHTGDGTDEYGVVMSKLPREILPLHVGWTNHGPSGTTEVFNPRNGCFLRADWLFCYRSLIWAIGSLCVVKKAAMM